MAATVRGNGNEGLVDGAPFDLAATPTGRAKARIPEVLVGTLLVAVFALAGAWFYSTSTERTGYVALRQEVDKGALISRQDLTVFEVSSDSPIRGIAGEDLGSVVGKLALSDMAAGTLVTPDQFLEKALIAPGDGVVGLELLPGEFPTFSLRPGDRVRVIVVPPDGSVDPESIVVVAEDVEVIEVVETGGRDRFVSLTLPTALADVVTVADSQSRVRLVQVPGS